jgi:hypothetical protein
MGICYLFRSRLVTPLAMQRPRLGASSTPQDPQPARADGEPPHRIRVDICSDARVPDKYDI